VGSGAGAAVGVVAESVDVHAALSVGVVAGNVPCDLCGRGLVLLLKGDGTLDVGVSTEDGDWWVVVSCWFRGVYSLERIDWSRERRVELAISALPVVRCP
jgi:hypothetical protein